MGFYDRINRTAGTNVNYINDVKPAALNPTEVRNLFAQIGSSVEGTKVFQGAASNLNWRDMRTTNSIYVGRNGQAYDTGKLRAGQFRRLQRRENRADKHALEYINANNRLNNISNDIANKLGTSTKNRNVGRIFGILGATLVGGPLAGGLTASLWKKPQQATSNNTATTSQQNSNGFLRTLQTPSAVTNPVQFNTPVQSTQNAEQVTPVTTVNTPVLRTQQSPIITPTSKEQTTVNTTSLATTANDVPWTVKAELGKGRFDTKGNYIVDNFNGTRSSITYTRNQDGTISYTRNWKNGLSRSGTYSNGKYNKSNYTYNGKQ